MTRSFRCFFLLVTVAFISCSALHPKTHKPLHNSPISNDILTGLTLKNVRYDTIENDFFYEVYLQSYISGDAIVGGGGLIKFGIVNEETYLKGYFILNNYYLKKSYNQFGVLYNQKTTETTEYEFQLTSTLNFNLKDSAYFTPACGLYYKGYHLKLEVVFLGNISHRIPVFVDCANRNKISNYTYLALPTYLITNVMCCKVIQ